MRLLLRRAMRVMGQQLAWLALALVLDAAIAVMAILAVPSVKLSGLLGLAPLLACFDLDDHVAAALALPDLGAAIKRVVRLLLEHAGDGLADDVLLVLGEPLPVPRPQAAVVSG